MEGCLTTALHRYHLIRQRVYFQQDHALQVDRESYQPRGQLVRAFVDRCRDCRRAYSLE